MAEDKCRLEIFGIDKEMTTHEYVLWLYDTDKGKDFVKTRLVHEHIIGSYFGRHVTKSQLIADYAKTHEE